MKRRILSALLASLILISATACASGGDDPAVTDEITPAVTTEEATTEPPETKYELAVKTADYQNAEFHVLTVERQTAGNMYQYIDIDWAEDLQGDVYNDAIHTRNQKIEEDYKVVIKVTQNAKPKDVVTNLVSAGDATYSMASFKMNEILAVAQTDGLHDISKLDALQLDAPWWDEAIVRDLNMGSKRFILTGNISVLDEEMLYIIMCNKKLLKDNNMPDPYTFVREGTWTIDKLHEQSKGVNKDLDGNGIFDEKDMYGFGNDYSTSPLLFYAGGASIAKMVDGVPTLVLMSEKNEQIVERIAAFYNDESAVINVSSKLKGNWTTLRVMMEQDQLLYRQGNVYNIPYYRGMISDFGVLPMPKYSEDQEEYLHVVASQYATGLSIPISVKGEALERTCVIVTALSAASDDTMDAYYDVNLKSKNARDEESADMLEIIFNSKCYDLGKVFDWGKLETNVLVASVKAPGTLASKYEANKAAAETAMAKSFEFFK